MPTYTHTHIYFLMNSVKSMVQSAWDCKAYLDEIRSGKLGILSVNHKSKVLHIEIISTLKGIVYHNLKTYICSGECFDTWVSVEIRIVS